VRAVGSTVSLPSVDGREALLAADSSVAPPDVDKTA